jgi:hypothetical protein
MTQNPLPQLTSADRSVLGPLAEHRFLTVPQLAVLLGVGETTVMRRCRALADARLLRVERIFHRLPAAAMITAAGLAAVGSQLGPPALNLSEYRHDVGVGWLWLAARAGRFGEPRALFSERALQGRDATPAAAGEPHADGEPRAGGIGIGIFGADGRARRHYPDLLVALQGGGRVAVELELTAKSAPRMAAIMAAYASDARITRILYVAGSETVARGVQRAAAGAEIAARVQIRLLASDGIAGASIAAIESERRRARRHAGTASRSSLSAIAR